MSDRAERLYEEALALPPEARRAFVEDACGRDPELGEELMSLLETAEAADQFFTRLSEAVFSSSSSSGASEHGLTEQTVDPELPSGDVVGHYRIMSLIGKGGIGTVYRAHDTRLNRDVALKFLPLFVSAEPDAQERLLMEARAVAALDHPNVCSIHEIGESDDGRLFIAMPCYEGRTLKERQRDDPLSLDEAVATAIQITRALKAAHERGIIHRDVKPGNVMLASDGTVKLLDFGLAMVMDATLATSSSTRGTVAYMSPEQARSETLDERTDLWSLGVVLYELLAGVRPFRGPNAPAILRAILNDQPEPIAQYRPGIPAALTGIVDRLLQKEKANRYGSARDVLLELERFVSPGASRRSFVRRRPLVAGSALLLLILIATFAWRGLRNAAVVPGSAHGRAHPSIAVLPVVDLSADSSNRALASGVTEDLIATLASIPDLRLIASTSAARFKRGAMDVRTIADSLGVSNILDASLQKMGSRIRLRVRLIDGRDGTTRWSQSYDREFKETFAVQEEITRAVAAELELRFDRDRQFARHHPRNIAAYELYVRGSDPVLLRSQSGIWTAQDYFQQAIAADPSYAAAHAGLALTYVRRARNASDPGLPIPELFALANAEAMKAVALDDSLAEAHYTLGRVREAMLDFPSAEREIRRAIAIDPTRSIYRRSLSYVVAWFGRPEEELSEARRALETDPLNPYALAAVAGG